MCKCMSTTVCVNGNVQFTFHLVMRLNITTVMSFNSLIGLTCILSFSLLEFENGLKKIVQKVPGIKYISCDFLFFYFSGYLEYAASLGVAVDYSGLTWD